MLFLHFATLNQLSIFSLNVPKWHYSTKGIHKGNGSDTLGSPLNLNPHTSVCLSSVSWLWGKCVPNPCTCTCWPFHGHGAKERERCSATLVFLWSWPLSDPFVVSSAIFTGEPQMFEKPGTGGKRSHWEEAIKQGYREANLSLVH